MRLLKSFRRTQNDCHKRNEDMRVELEITFEKCIKMAGIFRT